jgi:hypothetical protein
MSKLTTTAIVLLQRLGVFAAQSEDRRPECRHYIPIPQANFKMDGERLKIDPNIQRTIMGPLNTTSKDYMSGTVKLIPSSSKLTCQIG